MNQVQELINNPILRQGLKVLAPEVGVAVDLATIVMSSLLQRKPSAQQLVMVIDQQLADVLRDLVTTESEHYRRECEIRAHALLGVLMAWDKIA